MPKTNTLQLLQQLGFTELEAATYAALAQESPLTAYQVAQRTGKPVANTYKAIESLQAKGAVQLDDGKRRLCSAVDARELFPRLHAKHKQLTDQAAAALTPPPPSPKLAQDTRVYQLTDVDAVYARARSMINAAGKTVVVDAFPKTLDAIADALTKTAKRKVAVIAQIYAPAHLPKVKTVLFAHAQQVLESEPGQLLCLITDRSQLLLALISHDEKRVIQAIYTSSSFLASFVGAYLGTELCVSSAMHDGDFRQLLAKHAKKISTLLRPDATSSIIQID